jgi:hypothetical protein
MTSGMASRRATQFTQPPAIATMTFNRGPR